MLEATSKIFKHSRAKTLYLTIPASVAEDSAFPFKEGEIVKIKIEQGKLIIRHYERSQSNLT